MLVLLFGVFGLLLILSTVVINNALKNIKIVNKKYKTIKIIKIIIGVLCGLFAFILMIMLLVTINKKSSLTKCNYVYETQAYLDTLKDDSLYKQKIIDLLESKNAQYYDKVLFTDSDNYTVWGKFLSLILIDNYEPQIQWQENTTTIEVSGSELTETILDISSKDFKRYGVDSYKNRTITSVSLGFILYKDNYFYCKDACSIDTTADYIIQYCNDSKNSEFINDGNYNTYSMCTITKK